MAGKPLELDAGLRVDGDANVNGQLAVTGDLIVTGNLNYTGISTSDLIPASNLNYNIGNTALTWNGLYIRNMFSNATHLVFRNVTPTLTAGNTTYASITIPPGAAKSSGQSNGDIWALTTNVQIYINGGTRTFAYTDGDITGSANNTTYLNGQAASYYTDIASRLGYNPVNKAGDTSIGASTYSGNLSPTSNTINLGNTIARWIVYANTADINGITTLRANAVPVSNTQSFGNTISRWNVYGNTGNFSGDATFSANVSIVGTLTVNSSPIDATSGTITTTANGLTFTGAGSANIDVTISRSPSANAVIKWDEVADIWKLTNDGTNFYKIMVGDSGTYAISISGLAANATYALTSNASTYLNGQAASYYTDIPNRLGYTPINKASDTGIGSLTLNGNLNPASNSIYLGQTTARWTLYANSADVTNGLAVGGNITAYSNINPTGNTQTLGQSTTRWVINANTGNFSGAVTMSSTLSVSGTISGSIDGSANNTTYLNGQAASYYLNASNLGSGTLPEGRLTQASASANGIMRVVDSVSNTSTTVAAAANSVKTAYDNAVAAYSNAISYAASIAGTAYSNAISYAANASNLGSGTVSASRLSGTYNISVGTGGTVNVATLQVAGATVFNHACTSYTSAKITFSTSDPSGGSDGDIWLKYTA